MPQPTTTPPAPSPETTMHTYYVACLNASGGPEIVQVQVAPAADDEDGDAVRVRLEDAGYSGPMVIFSAKAAARFLQPSAAVTL